MCQLSPLDVAFWRPILGQVVRFDTSVPDLRLLGDPRITTIPVPAGGDLKGRGQRGGRWSARRPSPSISPASRHSGEDSDSDLGRSLPNGDRPLS